MKNLAEEICSFHCPRWHELPEISLYMDQVLSILEKALSIFVNENEEKIATAAMINNYVKQKICIPPIKKRYHREHLAYLIIVCITKRVLSISEIYALLERLLSKYSIAEAYDLFCDELEYALQITFNGCTSREGLDMEKDAVVGILRATLLAFANRMLAKALLSSEK